MSESKSKSKQQYLSVDKKGVTKIVKVESGQL